MIVLSRLISIKYTWLSGVAFINQLYLHVYHDLEDGK